MPCTLNERACHRRDLQPSFDQTNFVHDEHPCYRAKVELLCLLPLLSKHACKHFLDNPTYCSIEIGNGYLTGGVRRGSADVGGSRFDRTGSQ
jgi:hypothetical protein